MHGELTALSGVVVAVHASVDGRALHVLGLVLLAGHVGDRVLVHPGVRHVGVTTIAGAGVTAVDQHLDGGDHIALSAVGGNLDSVGDGGHGGVRPARSTTEMTVRIISTDA